MNAAAEFGRNRHAERAKVGADFRVARIEKQGSQVVSQVIEEDDSMSDDVEGEEETL